MKVYLAMENPCLLKRRLLLEGDEVVASHSKADIILTDKLITDTKGLCPVVGGDYTFPRETLEAFGYGMSKVGLSSFYLSKWFDPLVGFDHKLIFTFPLVGLMNGGLSQPLVTGAASRYCNESPLNGNFDSEDLLSTLKEMKYIGFVSLGLDLDQYVNSFHLGIPGRAFYNVIEGIPNKLTDFFTDHDHNPLTESWTVNLLVSRYPYPHTLESKRHWIKGICSDFERHFWFFDLKGTKKAHFIDSTLVGLSTAWGLTLGEANRRALWTAQGLDVKKIQYRTDLARCVSELWHVLQQAGLVGQALDTSEEPQTAQANTS